MSERFMKLPRYLRAVEGEAALAETLTEISGEMGFTSLCLVTGQSISHDAAGSLAERLRPTTLLSVTTNDAGEVEALAQHEELLQADAVLAIGGGKTIDVAKTACLQTSKPVISCPTQLATDGIASPVSVIRDKAGQVQSLPGKLPMAVVCDLDLVADAPAETLRAGFGDLISNLTALHDWRLATAAGVAEMDDFAALLAQAAADLALSLDRPALAKGHPDPDFLRRLLEGLVLSGLAMEIAGSSRPCSGAEHLISHALDHLAPGTAHHGEQVAFGTLIASHLQGGDWRGLRSALIEAGLEDAVKGFELPQDLLIKAIQEAPATRPDRYTVLNEADLSGDSLKALVNDAVKV